MRRPVSTVDLTHLLERLERKPSASPVRSGRIISFLSNKGGVGKSTLSVNTAVGLAKRYPERVLLIDTSLQMGVCASMLGLEPATSLTDAARERKRLDELLVRQLATPHPSSGLHLLAAPADAMEGADVDDEVISRILTLARRSYDFVIVDTFPMFDRTVMAVLDLSDRVYVVIENVVPTLLGATKMVKLLDSVGYPADHRRIVLNRYSNRNGGLRPEDVALRLGRVVDHVIPFDRGLITAANLGEPFVLRPHLFSRTLRRLRNVFDEIDELGRSAERNGQARTAFTTNSNNETETANLLP